MIQDSNNDVSGTGDYNLYFTQVTESFSVPSGDEGGALTNGGVHAGTIDLGDMDIWTFNAEALDSVQLDINEPVSVDLNPYILVYGPDGTLINSNSSTGTSASLTQQISVSGTYTVVVQDANSDVSGQGDYELTMNLTHVVTSVPSGAILGDLANGGVTSGAIDFLNDVDKFNLSVSAGDVVRLKVGDIANSGHFSPVVHVFSSSGALLATNASGSIAQVVFNSQASDTVTVAVSSSAGSTGSYDYVIHTAISQQSYIIPSGDQGGNLANGGVATGRLSTGDMDMYSLNVKQGDRVRLKLGDTANSGHFTAYLQVYASDGSLVATNNNGTIAQVVFEAEKTDRLTVIAMNSTTSTGGYDYALYTAISKQNYITPSGDQGGGLANGGVATGRLSTGDMDMYTLNVKQGDRVRLKLGDTANSGHFTTYLQVYASDGSLVATNNNGTIAQVVFEAEKTDRLTVIAMNSTRSTGVYDYALYTALSKQNYITPDGDQGGGLANGGVATGRLSTGDMDMYSLNVKQGDRVRLKLGDTANSGHFTTYLQVYASDGSLVATNNNGTIAQVVFEAEKTDRLTVIAMNSTTSTGVYDYALYTALSKQNYITPDGDQGGGLANGGVATGRLSTGDMDMYSLNVKQGDRVRLKLGDTANSGHFTAYLQVYASDGSLVATNNNGTIAQVVFEAEKTDRLTVMAMNSTTSTGVYDYALYTTKVSREFRVPLGDQGGVLANGVAAPGSLPTADMDIYSISVSAGDSLNILLQDADNSGHFNPYFQVFRKDASLLAQASAGRTAQIDVNARANEALTIVVMNGTRSTGSYDYSLTVTGANSVIDSDGDGLSDIDEVIRVTNINIPDTDGDGLTDGEEANTYGTEPVKRDTDKDGINDGDEINTHGTNPLKADTDDDSFSDSEEIEAGTDPLDKNSFPVEEIFQVPLPMWAMLLMGLIFIRLAIIRQAIIRQASTEK